MEEERMKRLEERRKIIEEEIGQSSYHVIVEDTARCTDVQYADPDEIDYCRRTRIYPECLASLHKKGVIQIPDLLGEERKNYFFVFAKRRVLKANEGTQEYYVLKKENMIKKETRFFTLRMEILEFLLHKEN